MLIRVIHHRCPLTASSPRVQSAGSPLLAIFAAGAVVLAAVVAGGWLTFAPAGPPRTGDMQKFIPREPPTPVPDAAFISPDGTPIKLADKRGKLFGGEFLGDLVRPCLRELPALARLQAGLGAAPAELLLISVDRGGKAVFEPFLKAQFGRADLGQRPEKHAVARAWRAWLADHLSD